MAIRRRYAHFGGKMSSSQTRFCSQKCYLESGKYVHGTVADPTPAEILARSLAIQREWSDAERLKRMRADQRPVGWSLPVATPAESVVVPISLDE